MKLAASNVDLREEGAGVTVPVKGHRAVCECTMLTTLQIVASVCSC